MRCCIWPSGLLAGGDGRNVILSFTDVRYPLRDRFELPLLIFSIPRPLMGFVSGLVLIDGALGRDERDEEEREHLRYIGT